MITVVAWPESVIHTARNSYGITSILTTCIFLRKLATHFRWHDLELLFEKHFSRLSECFRDTLECFIKARGNLVQGPISASFISRRAPIYSEALQNKCGVIDSCIGFIDGKFIGIARPGGSMLQNLAQNGTKERSLLRTKHSALQMVSSCMDLVLWKDEGTTGSFLWEASWTRIVVLSWLQKESNTVLTWIVYTARESTCTYLSRGIVRLMRRALTTL